MRAGQFVEFGPAETILAAPKAGYALQLHVAVPQLPQPPVL